MLLSSTLLDKTHKLVTVFKKKKAHRSGLLGGKLALPCLLHTGAGLLSGFGRSGRRPAGNLTIGANDSQIDRPAVVHLARPGTPVSTGGRSRLLLQLRGRHDCATTFRRDLPHHDAVVHRPHIAAANLQLVFVAPCLVLAEGHANGLTVGVLPAHHMDNAQHLAEFDLGEVAAACGDTNCSRGRCNDRWRLHRCRLHRADQCDRTEGVAAVVHAERARVLFPVHEAFLHEDGLPVGRCTIFEDVSLAEAGTTGGDHLLHPAVTTLEGGFGGWGVRLCLAGSNHVLAELRALEERGCVCGAGQKDQCNQSERAYEIGHVTSL